MSEQPQLHSSIVAMISLASGIAARHPDMGLCQLDRLRSAGVPEHQINTVIEIARHIRDEAAQKLDTLFDAKTALTAVAKHNQATDCCGSVAPLADAAEEESCGCSPTPGGQSCC